MSICIVHRDGWAVADSRDSFGTLIFPSIATKVSKAEGFLIAHVGDGILAQKIERTVRDCGHDLSVVDKVGELLEDKELNGQVLVVSYKRKLTHIDGNGCFSDIDSLDFWAIGACEQFVLGRLLYIAESRPITIDDAEAAVKAAALFDTSIDARVQRFWLDRAV